MLWSSNAANANSQPNWRILPKVSNQNVVYRATTGANSSATVFPVASNTGIVNGMYVYNKLQPLGTVASSTTTAITTAANLPTGGVGSGANLTFSVVPTNASLYQNTTPTSLRGANTLVVGVYGVTPKMANVAHAAGQHKIKPGWYVTKSGMGPSINHKVTAAGTLYSNNDLVKVTSTIAGTINCSANVITNGSGVIQGFAFPFSNNGGLFVNTSTTSIAITTATGSAATFSFALGGRANRVRKECLVSVGTMNNDTAASNTTMFPNS